MATCYICGAHNADYRREVSTGHSTGWHFGKRISSSIRSYYSKRSVCAVCAKQIDENNENSSGVLIFLLIVGIIGAVYFFSNRSTTSVKQDSSPHTTSSYHYSGQTARIISTNGLNLRDEPNSNGTVLLTIPYNETVGIVDKNGESETISGQTANWFKVDYNGTTGWIWSGYLQTE